MKKPLLPREPLPKHDLGQEALNKTWTDLQVDPEWGVREPGAFTWWGSRFATRVWAEPEVDDDGFLITRLRAETDLVRGARTDAASDLFLATLGRSASLSGIVRDEADPGTLKLHTSVLVYIKTAHRLLPLFRTAVVLQAETAHRTAARVAEAVGGEPAESPHPMLGFRESPDKMLAFPQLLLQPDHGSSPWEGVDMGRFLDILRRPPCLLASGDETGLTAEFPFLRENSLLTLSTKKPHPALGSGLLAILRLPSGGSDDERASLTMRLNALDAGWTSWTHFAGSWCSDDGGVAYVSFLPNVVYVVGLSREYADGLALKARWVAERIFHDDWARTRATCDLEHLACPEVSS